VFFQIIESCISVVFLIPHYNVFKPDEICQFWSNLDDFECYSRKVDCLSNSFLILSSNSLSLMILFFSRDFVRASYIV